MELSLWDAALVEVVRQVEVHCQERGRLLEAIRARHVTLFDQLLTRRQAEIEELARQHAEKMKSAVDAASRTGKVALLFQRAVDHELLEKAKGAAKQVSTEQKQAIELTGDLEQSQAKVAALSSQLLKNNWASVMRMKAWLRLRLERWRQKAHEHQQLRGPK